MQGMRAHDLARRSRGISERTIERMEAGKITAADVPPEIAPVVERRLQAALGSSERLTALLKTA